MSEERYQTQYSNKLNLNFIRLMSNMFRESMKSQIENTRQEYHADKENNDDVQKHIGLSRGVINAGKCPTAALCTASADWSMLPPAFVCWRPMRFTGW
ncbi:hypothetical protein HED51_15850 [Ochrobactrum grignonense]|nr:hypothetical protein [Brucella grignonensis]